MLWAPLGIDFDVAICHWLDRSCIHEQRGRELAFYPLLNGRDDDEADCQSDGSKIKQVNHLNGSMSCDHAPLAKCFAHRSLEQRMTGLKWWIDLIFPSHSDLSAVNRPPMFCVLVNTAASRNGWNEWNMGMHRALAEKTSQQCCIFDEKKRSTALGMSIDYLDLSAADSESVHKWILMWLFSFWRAACASAQGDRPLFFHCLNEYESWRLDLQAILVVGCWNLGYLPSLLQLLDLP